MRDRFLADRFPALVRIAQRHSLLYRFSVDPSRDDKKKWMRFGLFAVPQSVFFVALGQRINRVRGTLDL